MFVQVLFYFIFIYGLLNTVKKTFKINNNFTLIFFITSLIFFICLINSYLVFFEFNKIFKILNYFLVISISSFGLYNFYLNKIKIFYSIKKLLKKKIKTLDIFIIIFIISYLIFSLSPAVDVDTMRYHLAIPEKILENNFYKNPTLDYLYIGYGEIISLIGLLFKFDNSISILNAISLLLIYILNKVIYKKYKIGLENYSTLIILSIPYLLSNLSSQKIFLFPCFLITYISMYICLEKKINFTTVISIAITNIFCLLSKNSFFFIFIINNILILILLKNNKKELLIYSASTIILLFLGLIPFIYFKNKIFFEPLSPFVILNNENNWLINYKEYILNYGSTIFKENFLETLFGIIIPIDKYKIVQSVGLSFLLGIPAIFYLFKNKKLKLAILLILYFSTVMLVNIQARWFLPYILLTSVFFTNNKNNFIYILKKIILIQCFGIFFIVNIFNALIIPSIISNENKVKFINNYIYGSNIKNYINSNYKYYSIISDIENDYYLKNDISLYGYNYWKDSKNKHFNLTFEKNKNYIIVTDNIDNFNQYLSYLNSINIYNITKFNKYFSKTNRIFFSIEKRRFYFIIFKKT